MTDFLVTWEDEGKTRSKHFDALGSTEAMLSLLTYLKVDYRRCEQFKRKTNGLCHLPSSPRASALTSQKTVVPIIGEVVSRETSGNKNKKNNKKNYI